MMIMKTNNFNDFCYINCDGLYDPKFPNEADQCTGYKQLKKMVIEGIRPASMEETYRWETNPTKEELWAIPDTKYLRGLHPLLRPMIIANWDQIKNMKID